ncbi:MAG TPA: glutathione S-transferase family protein [Sorangium sp.]|nr:glutathione S-transferase family protein [Sorangium sp.]
MARPTLYDIDHSPWSERARWALDHRGVDYLRKPYAPLVDELGMRLKLGRPAVAVSTPVMFVAGGVLKDSFDIALYAERHGHGTALFPVGRMACMRRYNRRAERLLGPGRMCTVARMLRNPRGLVETLPPELKRLGPLAVWSGRLGARMLVAKYGLDNNDEQLLRERIRHELRLLREDLAAGGGQLCGDTFGYADILMASALAFVQPVADRYIRLGVHERPCWQDPVLADEFADVIKWRDGVYAAHR